MTPPLVEAFDTSVRRSDPDRWLASRFIADQDARADVLALYAYDGELTRAVRIASNPLIAEVRLVWWREMVDEIDSGGRVRAHPVAEALAAAARRHRLPRERLEAMIDGRIDVLDVARLEMDAALRWADRVTASAAALAAIILDAGASPASAEPAGRLWGLHLLASDGRGDPVRLADRIRAERPAARRAAQGLSVAAFPAVAYASLALAPAPGQEASPIEKRLRLLWAIGAGRI